MKAFFSVTDELGGAEQIVYNLAKFYKQNKVPVIIIIFGHKTNSIWIDEFVEVKYCNNKLYNMIKIIKNRKFRSVFSSHLIVNSLLGLFRTIGFLRTKKLICRESTLVFGRYKGIKLLRYKFAYWFGYRNIDLLITQTFAMSESLKSNISYLEKRIKIKSIPNPFIFPSIEKFDKYLDISDDFIVSAGRLIPEKGFDILIKAFSEISKEKPEMNLIILGEGSERKQLECLISELNLKHKVLLKGHVQNVYPYFQKAIVCVVASRMEGFPNVLLQMMSQNNNVVSTLCAGGIEEIPGIYTCRPNDIKQLADVMKSSLRNINDGNRVIFDDYLAKRSVPSFVEQVNHYLNA